MTERRPSPRPRPVSSATEPASAAAREPSDAAARQAAAGQASAAARESSDAAARQAATERGVAASRAGGVGVRGRARGVRQAFASSWQAAAATVEQQDAARREARGGPLARARRFEPSLDPAGWVGALVGTVLVAAALWIVRVVDDLAGLNLAQYGIRPRQLSGLRGIVVGPFVQDGYSAMLAVTLPLLALGWAVLLAGVRVWAVVSVTVVVVGGALTWAVAPSGHLVVGASGLVFGWLGYVIARAVFSRRIRWIAVTVMVLLVFGTLLGGVVPSVRAGDSWQEHLCGFVAGVGIGWVLHPRGAARRQFRRSAVG